MTAWIDHARIEGISMTADTRTRRAWVLGLASLASLMCALDTLVVATALTTIQRDLGASVEELEWTINAYNLALAVLLIPAAGLGDRFGRRRMFAAGLGLFVLASAACALAPDVVTLAVARAVQGAGAALVLALGLTLVSAAFPAERRGRALGMLEGITGLAVLAGPGLGGVITQGVGWEWIFWLNVPIGLAVLPLVWTKIEESHGDDTALDVPGVLLVTGAALGLVWTLTRGNAAGWTSVEVLASAVAGAVLLIAFVARQRSVAAPLLPPHLFRARGFVAGNIATMGLFASIFGGVFFFSQFLQNVLGFSALDAGLGLLPWTSSLFVLAPLAGILADRIGNRPLLVGGLALTAVGIGWVALVAEPDMAYSQLVAPFVVTSIGASMAMPPAANAVLGSVAPGDIGKAAGVNSMLRELGGVLALAVLVSVFAGTGSYASPAAFVDGFVPAMVVCAALVACGAVAGAFVPGRSRPTVEDGMRVAQKTA